MFPSTPWEYCSAEHHRKPYQRLYWSPGRPWVPKKIAARLSFLKETLRPLNHSGEQSLTRPILLLIWVGESTFQPPGTGRTATAKCFLLNHAVVTAQGRCWEHVREKITPSTWTWRSAAAWETTATKETECDVAWQDEFGCSGYHFSQAQMAAHTVPSVVQGSPCVFTSHNILKSINKGAMVWLLPWKKCKYLSCKL